MGLMAMVDAVRMLAGRRREVQRNRAIELGSVPTPAEIPD